MDHETTLIVRMLLGLILLALVVNTFRSRRRRKKVRDDLLTDREPIAFAALFETHFAALGATQEYVQKIWDEVARILEIPPLLLRPDDRLDAFNVRYFQYNIFEELEYLLNIEFPKGDLEGELDFQTVGNIVAFMAINKAELERQKRHETGASEIPCSP